MRILRLKPILILFILGLQPAWPQTFIRLNQLGFRPADLKSAVVISASELTDFTVTSSATGKQVLGGNLQRIPLAYGNFSYTYRADFSKLRQEGTFVLRVKGSESSFIIHRTLYRSSLSAPLLYLLEQRCGYNPVFDTVCHQHDGIAVDGPDSGKAVPAVGGYHDASDYLRFLITTSYTTGILLFTYKEFQGLWTDSLNANGRTEPNGVPDILDEAKWGLDWMLKLCPHKDRLYHQVADDRDHAYWDLPYRDSTDYGWGKGNARSVYFATGKPQGLFQNRNRSTGVSNIAGRTAAVFALASWIWKNHGLDRGFSEQLLSKALELYDLGKRNLGFSESVPCKAPYRYFEKTFYDDLEWGAAELYRATGDKTCLEDGIRFAFLASDTSWMGKDTTHHYEYFPYVNLGHYELFTFVDKAVKESLVTYYKRGLQAVSLRAEKNAFHYGVPFIWVSNNLATGLITQALLYKKMTGSNEFVRLMFDARDWLLGTNPWGCSFMIGTPQGGAFPRDPHSVVSKERGIVLTGALVDGPVYGSIFNSLRGLRLTKDDPYAMFQSSDCVYHDDVGDYSTNEPTIDGSASMIFVLASFSR